ncbi:MAG: hypothetical protein NVS3B26_09630 [Mycobacteriales bacterium]
MLVSRLRSFGITSDVLHLAALASIAGSILTWRAAKGSGDAAHAERFGIFIGLWAPTFFALADAVGTQEVAE